MRPHLLFTALVFLSANRIALAMPLPDMSEPVPVTRLVENVSQYIKKHPKDAEGYYTLARVHSIAFAKSFWQEAPYVTVIRGGGAGSSENQTVEKPQRAIMAIPVGSPNHYGDKQLPGLQGSFAETREKPNDPVSKADLFHLRESVRYYARATELDPKQESYWLGLGWVLEQGAPWALHLGSPWISASIKKQVGSPEQWLNQAQLAYRRAYDLSKKTPKDYYNWLGIEAGENILRVQALLPRPLTPREKTENDRIRLAVVRMKSRPMPISPIIVPLGGSTSLPSLLSSKSATFDLTGSNLGKRWPWVGSDTGILVWDPKQSGKITSGRQLFGSVTWWIFWKNGYQALAALDNNADGTLAGNELEGISIWRDANGNGVSDLGEVKPVTDWGIVGLSVRVTDWVSGMPSNLHGVTRGDGKVVPSYDWTPKSLN